VIVVDTNVVVYAIVQLPQTALAQRVAALDPTWVVPPLWRFEFSSAAVTLVRGGALTAAQAEAAVAAADRLVGGRELAVDQRAVVRAALGYDLSAYDAQYIALAQQLGVPCVTEDARMARNASTVAMSMAHFISRSGTP